MRTTMSAAFAFVLIANATQVFSQETTVTDLPGGDDIYPLVTTEITVEQALRVFAKTLRARLSVEDGLELKSPITIPDGLTRHQYIETLAQEYDLIWYYDGLVLRIEPVQSIATRVVSTGILNGNEVLSALDDLGLMQAKFMHRVDARRGIIRISGPESYVTMIAEAVENMVAAEGHSIVVNRGSINGLSNDLPLPDTALEGGS